MALPDFMRDGLEDADGYLFPNTNGFAINQFTRTEFRDMLVAFKELQDKVRVLEDSTMRRLTDG